MINETLRTEEIVDNVNAYVALYCGDVLPQLTETLVISSFYALVAFS